MATNPISKDIAERLVKVAPERFWQDIDSTVYFAVMDNDSLALEGDGLIYAAAWCEEQMRQRWGSLSIDDHSGETEWLASVAFNPFEWYLTPLRKLELYCDWREKFGEVGNV